MGELWGGLFVLGLIMPGIVLLVSSFVVLRFAIQRGRLNPRAWPPWQYLIIHFFLGAALIVPFGSFGLIGWLIMPFWLFRGLKICRNRFAAKNEPSDPVAFIPRGRRSWGSAVIFTITAALLPWAIGLGVKVYLDSVGRPTLPVEGFLEPLAIPVLILLTFGAWSFPFLVLTSAAVIPWRVGFASQSIGRDSTLPLWSAYVAGVVAAVPIFTRVFWDFDSMLLLVPVGTALIPPMAFGYIVGVRAVRRRHLKL